MMNDHCSFIKNSPNHLCLRKRPGQCGPVPVWKLTFRSQVNDDTLHRSALHWFLF